MKVFLAVLLGISCRAGCPELQKSIAQTYNFSPSKLNATQQQQKAADMDRVWKMVEKDADALAPCLRAELAKAQPSSWFFFDGTALLMEVAASGDARLLRLRALENVAMDDVSLQVWVETVASFGSMGMDTRKAAERWLLMPEAKYSVPRHAFNVNAFTGAMILYGSMREDLATPELVRIAAAPAHPGRSNAVRLLLDQATPESWAALAKLDIKFLPPQGQAMVNAFLTRRPVYTPRAMPKTTREQFLAAFRSAIKGDMEPFGKLMEDVPDGELDAVAVLQQEDIPTIRQVRRKLAAGGNPHLLEIYPYFTKILYTLVK